MTKAWKEFLLYILIGLFSAAADFSTFFLLENQCRGISPELASLAGQAMGFLTGFFLNTFLNFKMKDKLLRRFLSYGGVCLVGMAVSTAAIWVLKSYIPLYFLKLLCLGGVSVLQFFLNKAITYKK